MKRFAAYTLAAALAGGAALVLPVTQAVAAPVGVMASVLDAGKPVVDQVQARRRVVRRRGGGRGGDAALAAGLIGAAVIGGAIIAQSEREREERRYERAYYYGQPGYGYYADPYEQQVYVPPRRRYVEPGYYGQPGYYPQRPLRHRITRDPAGGGRMHTFGP